MWINIIQENFKELLDTLKTKPTIIFLIATMFTTGYFMNKWTNSQDDCADRNKQLVEQIDSIREESFKNKYESLYWKKLYENNIKQTDSLIREKLQKPLEKKLK